MVSCFRVSSKNQDDVVSDQASSPPRGWNSYDSFSWTISEVEFLQNAQIISERLLSSGYEVGRLNTKSYIPLFIFDYIFHQSKHAKYSFYFPFRSKILSLKWGEKKSDLYWWMSIIHFHGIKIDILIN